MKWIVLVLTLTAAQASFASFSMTCKNDDGQFTLTPATPCANCQAGAPAYSFVGGEGLMASGIPDYDADMPGYIDYDGTSSKNLHKDVLFLLDGGTWTITVVFPKGFLTSNARPGQVVKATVDSTYNDIDEDELDDIPVTCTVQ